MESFTVRKLSTKAGTSVYKVLLWVLLHVFHSDSISRSVFLSSQRSFRSLGEVSPGPGPRGRPGNGLAREVRWGRADPKTFIVNFKMESGYEQTQKRRETSQTQK